MKMKKNENNRVKVTRYYNYGAISLYFFTRPTHHLKYNHMLDMIDVCICALTRKVI